MSYVASLNCSSRMEERWPLSVPLKMFCQIFSPSKQIATPIFCMVSDMLWFPPDDTKMLVKTKKMSPLQPAHVPVFIPSELCATRWPCVWCCPVCVRDARPPRGPYLSSCLRAVHVLVCLCVFLRKRAWHEARRSWRVHAESISSGENGFNRGRSGRPWKHELR